MDLESALEFTSSASPELSSITSHCASSSASSAVGRCCEMDLDMAEDSTGVSAAAAVGELGKIGVARESCGNKGSESTTSCRFNFRRIRNSSSVRSTFH